MKYHINQNNYHTFEIFEVNKMAPRSYFIPYPSKSKADAVSPKEKRYASPKVVCLNGEWDFKFCPRPAEVPAVLDTEKTVFDRIDVPSCWQFRGYDKPFYTNIRYQFPFDPPKIPRLDKVGKVFSWVGVDQKISLRYKDPGEEYNFVGIYRKDIEIKDPEKNYVISFLGVASCMDLYVNGKFVGYSEGAHNTAEFDLTGLLNAGKNEMLVVVHRWCNGTYLEDQDMFRNNGIFRDVLLRISEPTDICEIDAQTVKTGNTYVLTLTAKTLTPTDVTFTIEKVVSKGHKVSMSQTISVEEGAAEETAEGAVKAAEGTAKAVFEGLEVVEWNAEDPVLYDVYYQTESCCVKERIGFKTVKIEGDLFTVNGKKIKFHGVNHHDTSCTNGYTLTPDEIERDIKLCKEFNIDMIRTSHYPPDPLLLELADEYGIYIVDENDLETHGTFAHQLPPTYNTISHDKKWEAHYIDRISRLYHRDKIHSNTSIVMWSLGNEAGGYHNTDAMYDYLKLRSDLPVHYESAIHCKRIAYDVGSEMYPSVQMVHDVGEHCRKQKQLNDRPYFLCEYAHAMGVGPGNTESYWEEIYKYDNLIGGCVWEMVDHAVLHEDGSYTYGGDHGEWSHDGNFCVDGLFYPDRTPSAGAKIIKFIYRPIRVRHISGSTFEVFNTTAFSAGERYELTFTWNDGTVNVVTPEAGPLKKAMIAVPEAKTVDGNLSVIVTTVDKKTGAVVSEEQIVIRQFVPGAEGEHLLPEECKFSGGRMAWTLPDGQMLRSNSEYTILYRAATDNDTDLKFSNTMEPFMAQKERVIAAGPILNGYRIETEVENKTGKFNVTDSYEGTEDGILVTSTLHCVSGGTIIPRFGKTFRLDQIFDIVKYTGRTGESYCDMKDQFPIRTVECRVADMTEPNIRPQESGNRCDCTEASVSDGAVTVTFKAVDKPFELGIKPYSDWALCRMKHRKDEKRTGTYVTIQAFQQGIGTGACGPGVMPEYQYSAKKDYTLKFLISVK